MYNKIKKNHDNVLAAIMSSSFATLPPQTCNSSTTEDLLNQQRRKGKYSVNLFRQKSLFCINA